VSPLDLSLARTRDADFSKRETRMYHFSAQDRLSFVDYAPLTLEIIPRTMS
jgi:hypothetical protein